MSRTFVIPSANDRIPMNDNKTLHEKFIDSLVGIAVAMECIGEPQYNREVARRTALQAIKLLEGRKGR